MTTKPRVEWTDQNISTASNLWTDGKSITDLAVYFDVSRSTISGMIGRNRDKFEVRTKNGPRKPKWTEAQFVELDGLWKTDAPLRKIAAIMSVRTSTVHWILQKYRARYPARRKDGRQNNKSGFQSPRRSNEPVFGFIETQASERYDFTRYQIENTEPVAYWKLTGCQCHFPLEKFEAVSGPDTPCCGQPNPKGETYCNTHWRLMHEVRAR